MIAVGIAAEAAKMPKTPFIMPVAKSYSEALLIFILPPTSIIKAINGAVSNISAAPENA